MTIYILADPNRPVPNKTLDREIPNNYKYGWYRVDCIPDPNNVVRSINISHKKIVEIAKRCRMPEIMIVEEDVMFTHPDAIDYFLENKPTEFDIYLGGVYGLNQLAQERIRFAGPGAHEIHNFTGLHCYIIHSRYYDKFLAMPENSHIDDQPGMGRFFVCYPFIALQHPGWSSNNRQTVDYNQKIPPEFIYHGKED